MKNISNNPETVSIPNTIPYQIFKDFKEVSVTTIKRQTVLTYVLAIIVIMSLSLCIISGTQKNSDTTDSVSTDTIDAEVGNYDEFEIA